MSITLKRNPKESVDRLISRFNKKMQSSRILMTAKEKRYHNRKPNKRYVRTRAIMRDHFRALREKQKFY